MGKNYVYYRGSFSLSWEQRKFGELFDYERPDAYIVSSDKYSDEYSTPVLTANKGFILGYTNEVRVCNKECIIFDDFTLDSKYVTFPFMVKSSALKVLTAKNGYNLPFAYELLQATKIEILGHARHYISVVQPTEVYVPNNEEQIRIGKYIQTIDNLITLHQRKRNSTFLPIKPKKVVQYLADSWEQRKLGNCMELGSGCDYKHLAKGDIPVYGTGGYMLSVNKALSYDRDGIGIGRKGTIDKPYLLKSPFWTVDTLFFAIPKAKTDIFFLLCLFNKIDWKSKDESTGVPSLSKQTINSVDVIMPKSSEQKAIGGLFQKIDNLITLHQRKYQTKKEVNLRVKKIRELTDWTNAWEQRKLGEYFDERTERSAEGELISVTISSGIKKFSELNRHDTTPEDMSHYKVVCKGDIAYNSMRMWQGASGYSPYNGILSPAYTVITPKNNVSSRFFAYLLKLPYMIHLFGVHSQGLTKDTWNLKFPAFSEIECCAPIDVIEQDIIASTLEQLDNLITLHQRRLNKIQGDKNGKKRSFRRTIQRLF